MNVSNDPNNGSLFIFCDWGGELFINMYLHKYKTVYFFVF